MILQSILSGHFTGKDLLNLSPDVFDNLRNKLEELQKPSFANLFLYTNSSPWQTTTISSTQEANHLSLSVNKIYKQLLFLEQEFLKLAGYGLTEYKNFKEIEVMIQLVEKVNQLYELYTGNPELFKLDLQNFLTIKNVFKEEQDLNDGVDYLEKLFNSKNITPTLISQKIELLASISRSLDKYSEKIYDEDLTKYIEILESANTRRWFSNLFDSELKNVVDVLGKLKVSPEISREELLKEIKKISEQVTEWNTLFPNTRFPDKKLITRLRGNDFFAKIVTPVFWKTFESISSSRNPEPTSHFEIFSEIEKIYEILKEWKTQHRSNIYPEPVKDWKNIKTAFSDLLVELQDTKVKINQNQIERLPLGEILTIFKELENDLSASSVGRVKEIEKEFNTYNANGFLLEIKKSKSNPDLWTRQFEYS